MNEANKTAPSPRLSIQEGNLNDAEKQILHDFRHGWKKEDCAVPLVVSPKGSSVPEKPAEEQSKKDWQGAILRGSFLRDLFLETYCELDPREIVISRAWIEGDLDLNHCESRLPIYFANCVFSERLRLIGATIPGLILAGCRICNLKNNQLKDTAINAMHLKVTTDVFLGKEFNTTGEVKLNDADIGGQLICSGGQFEKGLLAQNLKTGNDVFLDKEFKAKGEVLLNGANIGGQLNCRGGQFEKGFLAQNLKTGSEVFLDKEFKAKGEVWLNGADIGRQLSCRGGYFEKGLSAQSLKTNGGVFLDKEFKAKGELQLDGADIGEQLSCRGGYFEKGLSAQSLKTNGGVFLDKEFKAKDKVRLDGADIGGQLSCRNGQFENGLLAQNLKTSSDVFLNEEFKAKGTVWLNGANIGGQLRCSGGHFEKGLHAQNLRTSSEVFLDKEFKTKGEVLLNGVDIGGHLICSGGHFEKGLSAQNLKTSGGVFLDDRFKAKGEVLLDGTDIGGQLGCRGGHFEKGLSAQRIKTGESVFLDDKFKAKSAVWLNGADIGGELNCSGGQFENGISAKYMSVKDTFILYGANIKGKVSLDSAKVGGEFHNMQTWSPENPCSADGFRYQKIKNNDDGSDDWKAGLKWLKHLRTSDKENFFPQPYQQLMNAYRHMGHTNWARKIGFELEKARSKEFKRKEWYWSLWYIVLKTTIGYGYKPFRFLWCAMGLLALGWAVFSIGHDGIISPPDKAVPAFLENKWISSDSKTHGDYPPFNPFIYSLEATFPVLPLGQLDKWHPSNDWIRGIRYLWTVIGSLLLAILALFGVGALGPRWKGDDDSG